MEEILKQLLTTKFNGVSATILDGLAQRKAKNITTEAEAKTYVDGLTIQNVIESYADTRAHEASVSAVKNYETKHNLKDGKPVDTQGGDKPKPAPKPYPDGDQNKPDDTTPAWAKQILEVNAKLTARLEAIEKGKMVDDRKTKVDALVSKAPESIKALLAHIKIDDMDEQSFNGLIESLGKEIETVNTDYEKISSFGSYRPYQAGGKKDEEASDAEVDAILKRI